MPNAKATAHTRGPINDLLPCPFCGKPPKDNWALEYVKHMSHMVWCGTLGCAMNERYTTVAAWNTRATVEQATLPGQCRSEGKCHDAVRELLTIFVRPAMRAYLHAVNESKTRHDLKGDLQLTEQGAKQMMEDALYEIDAHLSAKSGLTARQQRRFMVNSQDSNEPIAWAIIAANTGKLCGVTLFHSEVEDMDSDHVIPLYAAASAKAQWQPIETAPLGKMVLLMAGGWRHEWPGQVISHDTGECVLDSPTPEHQVAAHFAWQWMPLLAPGLTIRTAAASEQRGGKQE